MTAEKHLTKALRIEESLKRLLPDDKGENVANGATTFSLYLTPQAIPRQVLS